MTTLMCSFISTYIFSVFSGAASVLVHPDLSGEQEGRVSSPWGFHSHGNVFQRVSPGDNYYSSLSNLKVILYVLHYICISFSARVFTLVCRYTDPQSLLKRLTESIYLIPIC